MLSVCCVRNEFTRLWSLIRCIRSPISLVSKNDMGSFKSLIKKSLTNEMLIRIDMCNNNHLRIKSVAVRPITIKNSPNNISQMKPILLFLIPISTIDCVRNGRISCKTHPKTKLEKPLYFDPFGQTGLLTLAIK